MLKSIYQNNKRWIYTTYVILITEFVAFAVLPYILGKAIDALLSGDRNYLFFYIGLCLTAFGVGFVRRRLDSRIFCRIWGSCVTQTIVNMIDRNVDTTKIISRAGMVKVFADFYEYQVPNIISSIIDILVAAVIIIMVIPVTGSVAVGLVALSYLTMWGVSRRIQKIEVGLQHNREAIDKAITTKDVATIQDGYQERAASFIRHSDWDATGWAVVDILSIVAAITVVVALVSGNKTAGEIMATLDYTWGMFRRMGPLASSLNQWQQMKVADQFITQED